MIPRNLCLAIAVAFAAAACSTGEKQTRDSALHAPASRIATPDTLAGGAVARVKGRADSVGRNPIDTARIGRDTGRQSQAPAPNKQP